MVANQIFLSYKSTCNPNNKKLLLINEECTFEDIHLHGGYKCSDDGTWSSDCSPSYCDNGYFFDEINEKCIEEEICDNLNGCTVYLHTISYFYIILIVIKLILI